MKPVHYLAFVLCIACSSCVTFKQYDNRAKTARETSYEAVIIKRDGETITGQTLKHKNHDAYDPHLVRVTESNSAFTLDGMKYNDSNVIIFQDKRAYHKRWGDLYLIRLVKGKINLYYFDNTGYSKVYSYGPNGRTTVSSKNNRRSTFYFEKENEPITTIGLAKLKKAMKDNEAALAKLNSAYPKDDYARELNIEKLVTAIELYNK